MGLTDKQSAFIEEYLTDFNATQAALRAGYSEKTAYSIGHENLKKPEIADAIETRLNELKMTADEALMLLAGQARASMKDFLRVNPDGYFDLDLSAVTDEQLRAIKSVSITETKHGTNYRFELYDAQSALKEIIRLHRLDSGQSTESIDINKTVKASDLSDDELATIIANRDKR